MTAQRWDHTRTGRIVLTGLWADAALVMAASAYNGGLAFTALNQDFGAGVALGLAVDVALAVALVGDRALHLAGRVSYWGRALRITTALMSLGLNCGVAIWQEHYGVAVFHAFLPLLLILLSEYAQDSTLQFGEITAEHEAAVKADRDAQLAADRAAYEAAERSRLDPVAASAVATIGPAVAPAFTPAVSSAGTTGRPTAVATGSRPRLTATATTGQRLRSSATKPTGRSTGSRRGRAEVVDLDGLVRIARPILDKEDLGRRALAGRLSEATGTDVTPYQADRVKRRITDHPLHAVPTAAAGGQ